MRMRFLAFSLCTVLSLTGCNKSDDDGALAALPGDENIVEVIDGAADLNTVNEAIQDAALHTVFEGVGPYTLLAPVDTAFESFLAEQDPLNEEDKRIALANLVTGNVLPGFLTIEDIEKALEQNGAEGVTMRSMDDTAVTFHKVEDGIEVISNQGGRARLTGRQLLANNGAVLTIDSLLEPTEISEQ